MQPMVFSPSADVYKDICRGGEYHRLHVQFRPPDDGPVRPERCRGKRIADIIRRRKKQCIKLEIRKKLFRQIVAGVLDVKCHANPSGEPRAGSTQMKGDKRKNMKKLTEGFRYCFTNAPKNDAQLRPVPPTP